MRALIALVLASPAAAQDADPSPIDWQTDLAAARAQAQKSDKPLLAVFRCET